MSHSDPVRPRRGGAVFRRYVLFQVPGWMLAAAVGTCLYQWAGFSLGAAAAVVLLWITKDFALYPMLRASYEVDTSTPVEQLVGKRAVSTHPLAPQGYVRLRGELWRAEIVDADHTIDAGATVEVVGARGLTLSVRKVPPGSPPASGGA